MKAPSLTLFESWPREEKNHFPLQTKYPSKERIELLKDLAHNPGASDLQGEALRQTATAGVWLSQEETRIGHQFPSPRG